MSSVTSFAVKRVGAAVCALVIVLSSCSSDQQATPAEIPRSGGTFIQGVVRPASLDPAVANTPSERAIVDQLHDGLTAWNPRTLEPVGAVASRWEVSQDQKQWTFFLRSVQASNGEVVTAADVKYSLQRIAKRGGSSLSSDLLSPIVGFDEFANDPAAPDLRGIVVVDPTTVRIDLDQPFAELASLLGNPVFGIIHRDGAGASFTTGSMRIATNQTDLLTLEKAPGSNAFVDRVEIRSFDDVASSYAAMERGEVQWALVPAEKASDAGTRFGTNLFGESLRTLFLGINTTNADFADVRFREAVVRAIDRRALVEKMGVGVATAMNGVVPDGVKGSQNGGCAPRCSYDADAAQRLVSEVFPNGAPPLTLDVLSGQPLVEPAARQIVDDLARVGVTANLQSLPSAQFTLRVAAADRELFQTGWSGAYPSPGAFLSPLFLGSSPSNVSVFKNQQVDDKLNEAQVERDEQARERDFQEAERLVMTQFPIVPLAQFPSNAVAAAQIRGVDPLPTGNFDVSRIWIAPPPQ